MKTVQVFISHTSDMAQFPVDRSFAQASLDAVGRAGMAPIDMRYFSARDRWPADYCRTRVRDCEVYIAVVGFRYGSVVPGEGISYTELEFREAGAAGLPRLVFLLEESACPPGLADVDRSMVDGFRQRLRDAGLVVRYFRSADALELEVFHALSEELAMGERHAGGGGPAGRLVAAGQPATSFAALLRQLRADAGLTQKELAAAARVSARSVSDLERGIHPTARKASAGMLADALDLTGQVRRKFVEAARGLAPAREVLGAQAYVLAATGTATAASPPEVRYSLPPDAAAFTGRDDELNQITVAMAEAAGAGGVAAIYGMPGVGKTALAVHVAHRLRDQFPDQQLFIDLHGHTPGHEPVSAEEALARLLTAAGVDARQLPQDVAVRAGLWRDKMAGKKALLVLDNAASSDQITPLLPGDEGCLVLVTSRRHLGDLPGAVLPILLEVLLPDKAQEVFLRLASRAAPGPAVAQLVQLAGFLPLAISLLARVYVRHPAWTMADLITETRASMLTLAAENNSVAAAFEVSYRYLAAPRQQFFGRLTLHLGTTIDAYAAAALTGTSLSEATEHLDALHREALLIEVGYRRYGMHDLIRRYGQDRLAADAVTRGQALERLLNFYQHTAAIAEVRLARQTRSNPPTTVIAPPSAVPDLPDSIRALAWARAERVNLLACLDHATEAGHDARVVALTDAMAALLRLDGPWTDAITRHTTAVQAARRCSDPLGQANALNNLGVVQRATGDNLAAAQAHQEALSIFRDIGNRHGQANALNNLGSVRYQTGDYLAAAEVFEEALSIFRDIGNRHGQADALMGLGELRRLMGNYLAAGPAQEEVLSIFRDIGDRHGQANALNYLGVVRLETGDYLAAAQAHQEALSIFRDIGNRHGQAIALNHLGVARRATGDYLAAAQAHQEALSISRDIGNRLNQANALNYLGTVRRETGDYLAAAHAQAEALFIYRDLSDRGGEAMVLNEVGTLHRVCGELHEAEVCHREALDLAREIDSPWDQAHALAGLGRCAVAAGRTADAEARLRQAQKIFHQIGAAGAVEVAAELDALTEGAPTANPGYRGSGPPRP